MCRPPAVDQGGDMAIMGFLAHVEAEDSAGIERAIAAMPEMTTYGVHQGAYVVAVAEAPGFEMEAALQKVRALPGVLTTYVTSLTVEDEQLPDD